MSIRNCENCDNMECAANEAPDATGIHFPCDNCKNWEDCQNIDCEQEDCNWEQKV